MKKLMIGLMVIVTLLSFTTIKAQKKETINTSHKEEKIVEYNGITYYVIDGLWHTKMKKRYVLKLAPKGAKITFRPEGGKTVTMGGKKYYKCKGIFYKKLHNEFYQVVRL